MLDVSHLVCLLFHQPYLLGFYLKKNVFSLVSTVFVHNEIMCFVIVNMRMKVGRNREYWVETGVREGLKAKEFGGQEKLSLDNTQKILLRYL